MSAVKIKAKPNKKKSKGSGAGRKGLRHPELHDRGSRAIQPSRPEQPKSHASPSPVRRLVTIDRVEVGPWASTPDLGRGFEEVCVVAVLSDYRLVTRWAQIVYATGERERIMEAVADSATSASETERATRTLRNILCRRASAIQKCRGELEREYGNGVFA